MFFVISKIISFVLSPLIWIMGTLVWSLLTKSRKKRRNLLVTSFLLLVFFTNSFLVGLLTDIWAWKGTDYSKMSKTYKVGIVLGGNTISYNPLLAKTTYNYNIDRLMQALELYRAGKIEKIVVSGASGNIVYRNIKEGNLMRNALLKMGVPDSLILLDTIAENTYENAVEVNKLLQEHGIKDTCLLITSSIHMRRALACFNKQGIPVKPYATNLLRSSSVTTFDYLFYPYAVNITIWEGLTHEMLGYLVYKILGYN